MFPNLRAEMARRHITNEQIAKTLGLNPATVSEKLTKKQRLKLNEAQKIKSEYFPSLSVDYLFEPTEILTDKAKDERRL